MSIMLLYTFDGQPHAQTHTHIHDPHCVPYECSLLFVPVLFSNAVLNVSLNESGY